jgi:hypothetical protein
MVETKDDGAEFHISRPRIVALIFCVFASPIFFVLDGLGHETAGGFLWLFACIGMMIAYIRPTRLRRFMQNLIPTSAEKGE